MTTLRVADLAVEYSSGSYAVRPLDGFSLDAESGELVLLLGPSGCGKTTLLSCLAGILAPTSGSVLVGDTKVHDLAGPELTTYRRHTVGVVFQAFNLVASLSAVENVAAPLWSAGVRRRDARLRAAALLEQVDLRDRLRHHPGDMSGGQQQRVAIARALVHDPPLLLADEPTAHLDYLQVETVLGIIRKLAAPGRLVVVATHDDRMVPLADRVVEMAPKLTAPRGPVTIELDTGEIVFEQGTRGALVYVVESGEIEIVRTRADGRDERLQVARPGDYFGELGPVLGFPRAATARCRKPTVLTGYGVADFRRLVGAAKVDALLGRRPRRR